MCSTAARGTQVSGVGPWGKSRLHNAATEGIMDNESKDANRSFHQEK